MKRIVCVLFFAAVICRVTDTSASRPAYEDGEASGRYADIVEPKRNYVELDLNARRGKIRGFSLGAFEVAAAFEYQIKAEEDYAVYTLEGKDVRVGSKYFPEVSARIVHREESVMLTHLRASGLLLSGKLSLPEETVQFRLQAKWAQQSELLSGRIDLDAKIWGQLGNMLTTGTVEIEDGQYQGTQFAHMFLNFLGKPPVLSITDSKITLSDGGEFEVVGQMDIGNFDNIFPGADFVSQKLGLGEWELESDKEKSVEVKKSVDPKFDVSFGAYEQRSERTMGPAAEVRYKMQSDDFLRLRFEEDETVVGFERRKEF
ncbi:MAG: hypothetical protein GF333_04600 [Candidatus Omnitrophica bacterium]|nr:hypothetical protein [Candidatus Omnitrophota bacterium]